MSVSQVIANLRAREQANVDEALAQQKLINEVLSALPEDTPGELRAYQGGYCAEAYLVFKGAAGTEASLTRRLYELYPPMECVDLKGNTQGQKPLKYVRDQDRYDSQRPIFPVLVKNTRTDHSVRWWTTLAGHDVEIQVEGGSLSEFKDILGNKYVADSHSYATGSVSFLTRALARPDVRPGAMVCWLAAWTEFGEAQGFSKEGIRFLEKFAQHQSTGPLGFPFSVEDMLGRFTLPYSNESSPFTAFFSEEQRAKVVAFAKKQYGDLVKAREQQSDEFAVVRKWFEDFFGRFGFFYENDMDITSRILHKLHRDTGLDVSVRIMRPIPHTGVSIDVCFKGFEHYVSYVVPFSKEPNPPSVKAQDIDVDYVA